LEELVAAEPGDVEGWYLLAVLNSRLGIAAAAASCYEAVIRLDPKHADALYYLGNIRGQNGDHAAAVACFERALRLRPQSAAIARNLGATLEILQRVDDAIECYRRFLRQAPGTAEIYYNLGNALADQGAHVEAIASYRSALALKPGWLAVHLNLGDVMDETGDLDGAAAQYESAGAANPGAMAALQRLAGAHADQGKAEEAVASYGRAVSLRPDSALELQAAMVLPVIPSSLEEMQRWRARFAGEIDRLSARSLALQDPVRQIARTNFYLSYHGLPNRELHSKVAALYLRACPSLQFTAGQRRRSERIRVGFISRYLCDHSIGRTTRGLIANLSRERFEAVSLFVPPVRDDAISQFIRASSDRSVVLPPTLDGARRAIADLGLDVLFYQDIGMEPFTYFLAFSRLAPVQCVSFGHPDTTGIPAMDYFISNDLFEDADAQQQYSERLFLLRDLGTLAYYYRPEKPAAIKYREDFGFPEGARLYVCPQALFKLHPAFDATLGAILRADPAARLILIEGRTKHWGRLLRARFERTFPDVSERVVFVAPQNRADFTRLIAACHVMLDTPHFNGMNTSLEAFALGAPVVTMPTTLQRGRHTSGMYRKMGFDECVAESSDEYVRIALRLGSDPEYRRHVCAEVLERNPALFEDRRVVREFERFFAEAANHVR
jgi:predicted O-linked N-acetylglucosamine transferase (SPINDLY family)